VIKVAFDPQIFLAQKYGGISRYFCELAKALNEINKVSIAIVAPFYINAHLRNLVEGVIGFACPRLIQRYFRGVMKLAIRLLGLAIGDIILRLYSPRIIHETYYFPVGLGSKKAKRVLTIYDMIHEKFPNDFKSFDKTAQYKALAASRADHIICISESTKRDAIDLLNLNPDKVSVVHLGFRGAQEFDQKSFNNKNIKKNFLLYVGHRGGYKNFCALLKAYAASDILRSDYQLICFGGEVFSDNELREMRNAGLNHEQVLQFFGDDNLLAWFYKNASIFIYPSLYEGFGIPPLEAMSYECPVICCHSSSIPEVVGNAGEYFDPKDENSLRITIESLLSSDLRMRELRMLGLERIKVFSWDKSAQKTLDIYKKIL